MNIPKLRFDGFSDEWEDGRICDISCYKSSTIIANSFDNFCEDEIYPLYGAEGIVRYINFYQNDMKAISIIKDGAGVGRLFLCEEKSSVLGTMGVIFSNNRSYIDWLYYRLFLINFDKYKCGSTIPHVYYKDYSLETILLPSLPEQEKIADFLATLDEKIQVEKDILENLINVKKGYTQKIFSQELRFDGFSDEWKEVKLGDICDIKSGKSPSNLIDENGDIPFFKVEQLNNSIKYQINSPYKINYSKTNIVKKGSIIFPKRGASIMLNKIRLLKVDAFMDTNLMTLTIKDFCNNEFIYYFILYTDLSKIADTTSIPQINNKHIEPYIVTLPSLPEQEKIAEFLSTLDERIKVQSEIIDNLILLKKGLLQQLFC